MNVTLEGAYNLSIVPSPIAPAGPIAMFLQNQNKYAIKLKPLEALNKFDAMALAIHEGNPGHHIDDIFPIGRVPLFIKFPLMDKRCC